jgi:hypothetical protein
MLTRVTIETIPFWYSLRTSPNNHPHEGNIKGLGNHLVSIARTLEQLVKGKKLNLTTKIWQIINTRFLSFISQLL